ncbi:MAG TPA: DUF4159 domain-containing protein [Bryobacteraceae bacterium]|jgi:hypothetical protein|nr:DUF4159 domain-containing protein [Bryobacteraceae bacterium]
MKLARPIFANVLLFSLCLGLCAMQGGGYQRYGYGRNYYQSGPWVPSEFYWTRLQYTSNYAGGNSYGFRRGFGGWSRDYPKADNDCLIALRRLTHINSPSPLNVVDLDSDHLFDYPWIYAVQVNTWTFTDEEAKRLHDYLLKGGFLMVDDFHGTDQWQHFMAGMRMVLPDAQVEDLKDADEIYHVLYDINEKFQIPSEVYVNTGRTYELDGYVPKWRAIRNEHGRIMVAICANMHLGDAWEWADSPEYPEKFSGLAFRIVLNYITYAMTH